MWLEKNYSSFTSAACAVTPRTSLLSGDEEEAGGDDEPFLEDAVSDLDSSACWPRLPRCVLCSARIRWASQCLCGACAGVLGHMCVHVEGA
jgi:hypothetical protein